MSNYVNLLDIVYPVGSIYQTMNSVSPASSIGDTWSAIKTFLLGSTTSGVTGGEETHVLTVEEMPVHNHEQHVTADTIGSAGIRLDYNKDAGSRGGTPYPQGVPTRVTGGGLAHNNMPPYTTCFIWRRVS